MGASISRRPPVRIAGSRHVVSAASAFGITGASVRNQTRCSRSRMRAVNASSPGAVRTSVIAWSCTAIRLAAMRDGRAEVLYLAPWIDLGGSDKGTIDWFAGLDRARFAPSLITTQRSPNRWVHRVAPYAEELWVL